MEFVPTGGLTLLDLLSIGDSADSAYFSQRVSVSSVFGRLCSLNMFATTQGEPRGLAKYFHQFSGTFRE